MWWTLGPRRRLRAFAVATGGNFATLTALTAPVAIILAAFAIDEGALFLEKRQLQTLADLAAIAAVADLGEARLAAVATLHANNYRRNDAGVPNDNSSGTVEGGSGGVTVTTGIYTPDPRLDPAARFVAGGKPANAAYVLLSQTGTRYFSASFFGAPAIRASAVAAARSEAAFSIGSRLARLDGGVANAVLGGLTGSTLSLSIMDYEALLSAEMSMLSFLDSLDSRLSLNAFSYRDIADASATIGDIAAAVAKVEGFSAAATTAARRFVNQTGSNGEAIPLSKLFDIGSLGIRPLGYAPAGNDPHLNPMELLAAAAALSAANGRHQVELDLGGSITGLADVELTLAIGEPARQAPWFAIGSTGAAVRTAQTRLTLNIEVGGPGLSVSLPLYLELATAEARLDHISCPSGPASDPRVTIAARPGIVLARIAETDSAELTDFDRPPAFAPARLVSTPVLKVKGRAELEIANGAPTMLRFNRREIDQQTIKRVSTTEIAGSLTRSLLSNLDLDVQVAGLGIGLPGNVTSAVVDTLGNAAPSIDALLANLLAVLGVSVGEADVRVHGASCGRAVLVQ
jgi:uncharacterized membrane protein